MTTRYTLLTGYRELDYGKCVVGQIHPEHINHLSNSMLFAWKPQKKKQLNIE